MVLVQGEVGITAWQESGRKQYVYWKVQNQMI